VDALHAERLRVGSIVITFFGDAVVPRGGEVWLGVVAALMERLRIAPGTLGAAMSRLTAEDWLVREKRGRRSHYRLADAGKDAFDEAARRIYALDPPAWTGRWTIRFCPDADPEAFSRAGFGQLGPELFARPEEAPERPAPAAVRFDSASAPGALAALAARAYPFEAAETRNAAFLDAFAPLGAALDAHPDPDPVDAIAARTLILHAFRRVVLKDPRLPPEVVPEDSARARARALVGRLYRRLLAPSEAWLDGWSEAGLTSPNDRFYARFGGLPRLARDA
jgi:phenylacetic acid degradation operon negative regulatory protein